jgi:four helix bundle protein
MEKKEKPNIVRDKSFQFAVRIVRLYKHLVDSKKEFILSKQILRSGTSVGANVREADNAQSKADFIHKLSIAQKECDETIYWLELLKETDFFTKAEFESINSEAVEIIKLLKAIIIKSKSNEIKIKH